MPAAAFGDLKTKVDDRKKDPFCSLGSLQHVWIILPDDDYSKSANAAKGIFYCTFRMLTTRQDIALRPDVHLDPLEVRKYKTYGNSVEEDQYWAAAELHGRRLRSSDARFAGSKAIHRSGVPVVTSYSPALLPYYRQGARKRHYAITCPSERYANGIGWSFRARRKGVWANTDKMEAEVPANMEKMAGEG
ncbi:hypothetical protein B0H17DRAFT_1137661 [Mycena rosella]|uniref:Uncharacterized protein n=1 Tax=Mycena rosella TaxID=1033263 RepID=A0AAD7GAK5_MYCRO|nr:hypothetical protein B0H17DRAFT_1137661 [Mycena rosella]